MSPLGMILLGFVMCVLGIVLPVLMILGMIETTFLLGFFAFALSISGVLLGIVGATRHVVRRRPRS